MATEENNGASRAFGAILMCIIIASVAYAAYAYDRRPSAAPTLSAPPVSAPSAPAPVTPTTTLPASPSPIVRPSAGTVQLDSVAPTSGPVGFSVTLSGSGFLADNEVLFNGAVAAADAHPIPAAGGRQSLIIPVPPSMGPDCKAGQACPMYVILVTPRAYSVSVENANGTSNVLSFIVTGSSAQP